MSSAALALSDCQSVPYTPANYQFGQDAAYRDIPNSKWGYKLFRSAQERNDNFNMQLKAYQHGLAPEVKDCFDDNIEGEPVYGFLTEAVSHTEQERFYNQKYIAHFVVKDYNLWWKKNRTLIHELNLKLHHIGLSSKDNANWANVGYLDGRLVTIDFSVEEFLSKG